MSKQNKQPYVRFFPSDWLAGTRGMTAVEIGIYITLIATMYERCEPIPRDEKRLARMCGCRPTVFAKALRQLIDDGKITDTEDGLWNKRVDNEFTFRRKKSHAGKQAATERWQKDQQKQEQEDADAMPSQCGRNAIPEARSQKPKNTNALEGFDAWYEAYPRKKSRGAAEKAYRKAIKAVDPPELLAKTRTFAARWRLKPKDDLQFCPYPASWLNSRGWEDADLKAEPGRKPLPAYLIGTSADPDYTNMEAAE